jgi:hypothetical protein
MVKAVAKQDRQKKQLERLYQPNSEAPGSSKTAGSQGSASGQEPQNETREVTNTDGSKSYVEQSTRSDYIKILIIGGVLLVGLLVLYAYDQQASFLNEIIQSTQLI